MHYLYAKNERLYWRDRILLCIYDAGDCDTCPWPMGDESISTYSREKQEENLRASLFDLREMEDDFDCDSVILPDGTVFCF